ncbi:MAG: hypothetical protein D3924_06820 [Candidatus Electrothrix sp. AR4]|nr:hypothetical protein [Candidatus Electrothrix sp. AR4]
MRFYSQKSFFALFLLAAKLWLVDSHYLMATKSPHDDLLFITQAHNLLSGDWGSVHIVSL